MAKSHININYSNHYSGHRYYPVNHNIYGRHMHHGYRVIQPVPYFYMNSHVMYDYPTYTPPRMRGGVYNSFYNPKGYVNVGFSI